ncbi:MAG: Gldg family protein [Verrucomicrobia bacterium]|nr:Gldg family protein [Verrucomicrobiota bacterium]
MNQQKQFQTFLYSTIGIAVMFLVVVAVNVISGVMKARVDLTAGRIFTLSAGTKAILAKLDTPVEVRFYYSKNENAMPEQFKNYAQRVEDLLSEFRQAAKGKIEIKKFNPEPDSDAEDSANLDGVQGQQFGIVGDKIYLGIAISMLDSKVALPFLSPDREKLLEYDLARAVSRVANPKKPVVGVMSPLQIFGQMNPMMMRMGQGGKTDPWVFISELKNDFDVKQIQMDVDKIDDDVEVLLVVHPKAISDKAQYAIDQFVLRGGKLAAFLDPHCVIDTPNMPGMNQLQQMTAEKSSSLPKLLKAWGLEFDVAKVAADMTFVTRINRGGKPDAAPSVLSLTSEGINTNDVVTSQIDHLLLPFGGAFSGTPAEGLKQTVLLKTTKASQLVEAAMSEYMGEQVSKDFASTGKELPLAVRLTGKFKTAFPDGKPTDVPKPGDDKDKKTDKPADTASLKESAKDGVVILVGDADMLYDQFSVRVQDFFGQKIVSYMNGNISMVQNMVEQLSGDSNLIAVRSRATMSRPFTVVQKMKAQAEDRYRAKLKDLEKSLQETQTKLGELQKNKDTGQRFIMSPEQQAEVKNFQKRQAEVKQELKLVRRSLNRDIDSLETRLKWLNIAGMPLLVTISGISLAVVKRKKTAAK